MLPDPSASVLQKMVSQELAGKLLLELKPRDRMLLVMKEMQELSLEEISEIAHMGVSAVKVALFRARKRMLDHYQQLYQHQRAGQAGAARRARGEERGNDR